MKNKINIKTIISLILTILTMILIFNFSEEKSDKSNSLSKGMIDNGITVYENITKTEVNHKKVTKKLNYPVRKLAHFSVYFLLGGCVYSLLISLGLNKKEIIAIIICMIYASSDEIHQLSTAGRSGNVKDVFIDTTGSAISVLIIMYIRKKIYARRERNKRLKTI